MVYYEYTHIRRVSLHIPCSFPCEALLSWHLKWLNKLMTIVDKILINKVKILINKVVHCISVMVNFTVKFNIN
jgi:hypothetical protein